MLTTNLVAFLPTVNSFINFFFAMWPVKASLAILARHMTSWTHWPIITRLIQLLYFNFAHFVCTYHFNLSCTIIHFLHIEVFLACTLGVSLSIVLVTSHRNKTLVSYHDSPLSNKILISRIYWSFVALCNHANNCGILMCYAWISCPKVCCRWMVNF